MKRLTTKSLTIEIKMIERERISQRVHNMLLKVNKELRVLNYKIYFSLRSCGRIRKVGRLIISKTKEGEKIKRETLI